MQTLKTAFVVLLLGSMFYGVYTVLNSPPPKPPKEVAKVLARGVEPVLIEEGGIDESPAEIGTSADAGSPSEPSRGATPVPKRPEASRFIGPHIEEEAFRTAVGLQRRRDEADPPEPPPASPEEPSRLVPVPDLADRNAQESESSNAGGVELAPTDRLPPRPRPGAIASADAGSTAASPQAPTSPPDAPALRSVPTGPAPTEDTATADGAPLNAAAGGEGSDEPAAGPATGRYADGVRFNPPDGVVKRALITARSQLEDNQYREALFTLSAAYEDPRLDDAQREQLLEQLDPLAARVVYSTEHLLEHSYKVERGDTLMSIADKYDVPWQLLQNINGVRNPEFLVPGTRLKVVRGPFSAEVNVSRSELTMYLNRLYAGRFPITVGEEPAPQPGKYQVRSKELGRTYLAKNGQTLPPSNPSNPYGRVWLDLGKGVAIHGSSQDGAADLKAGCISLSPRDADDVFAILSRGSTITIRR